MINTSWKEFLPHGIQIESYTTYLDRLYANKDYHNIPRFVPAQWIYLHHDNEWMLKNAWMDSTVAHLWMDD